MDRNKYMYALSRAVVMVESNVKGGTWSGALENLNHLWVTAFVRADRDVPAGNKRLSKLGLHHITDTDLAVPQTFRDLVFSIQLNHIRNSDNSSTADITLPLFPGKAEDVASGVGNRDRQGLAPEPSPAGGTAPAGAATSEAAAQGPGDELFKVFVSYLRSLLEESPKSEQEVARFFGIETLQAQRWLSQAKE